MARPKKQSFDEYQLYREREAQKELQLIAAKEDLINAPRVVISVPAVYAERIGHVIPISVNNEEIAIPVNGTNIEVPEPFAVALKGFLMQFDKEALRGKKGWGGNQGDFYPTGPIPGSK